MGNREYISIGAKIPAVLDEGVNEMVKKGYYLNRAEVVRVALRALLDTMKMEAG